MKEKVRCQQVINSELQKVFRNLQADDNLNSNLKRQKEI
jgi:hypothetical protein